MDNDLMALAKEYIQLDKEKKDSDANIDRIKKRMDEISPVLETYMEDNDFTFKIAGSTVYKQEQIWPKRKEGVTAIDVHQALRETEDWKWLVQDNVNGQKLASAVRECIKMGQELPPAIAAVLDAKPTIKIKVRHS